MTRPCRPCSDERMRWLDTTPQQMFPGLGFITQAAAAYDFTARGMADSRRIRHERWLSVVRFQMQLVADACRAAGHAPQPPRIVQLDLLGAV